MRGQVNDNRKVVDASKELWRKIPVTLKTPQGALSPVYNSLSLYPGKVQPVQCATMQQFVGILLLLLLAPAGLAQGSSRESADEILIRRLTIKSASLPAADRDLIIRLLQKSTYSAIELQDRIRVAFQDLGYFKVLVNDPKLSFNRQEKNLGSVDVAVTIEEGPQYRLGEIEFQNATLFSSEQMRKLFPINTGDVFNRARIAEGLTALTKLYDSEGHINFVAIPDTKSDDLHHTVDLVIDLDEGEPFDFGQLVLDGQEPHPGAGNALIESWKMLRRKRYSPVVLERWFRDNEPNLPAGKRGISTVISTHPKSHVVNLSISFP
jgi:hypothetical protein